MLVLTCSYQGIAQNAVSGLGLIISVNVDAVSESILKPACACGTRLTGPLAKSSGVCATCRREAQRAENAAQAKKAVQALLGREDVLILDTETTGSGKRAEIIELSVINTKGETLLDTLIEPRVKTMNPYAERVHGISLGMLKGAPCWPEVLPELKALADRRTLLAWNASFDKRMLDVSSEVWELSHPRWLFVCAMRLYARRRGIKNRGLQKCVLDENLGHLHKQYASHRALGDVYFTLEVLRSSVSPQRSI